MTIFSHSSNADRQWKVLGRTIVQQSLRFDRRQELKFDYPTVTEKDVELRLGIKLTELFEPRVIHSVYYDDQYSSLWWQGEEGINPRTKYRVRWYDDESSHWQVEVKRSEATFRLKSSESYFGETPKTLETHFGTLSPSAEVSYRRRYLGGSGVRVTVDTALQTQSRALMVWIHHPINVLEIKMQDGPNDPVVDLRRLTATHRFSKYGIALARSF